MSEHDIMTVEEVAQFLRISERTVYDWAQKGEIPCGKLGTTWRFKRTDIEEWVNERLSGRNHFSKSNSLTLISLLSPDRIIVIDRSRKEEALIDLINCIAKASGIDDVSKLKREIFHREELMSTGIGYGVAIPHVKTSLVKTVVMAACVNRRGLRDYDSLDKEPVHLIFMLLAPRNQHVQYLKVLSLLSNRIKKKEFRKLLTQAEDGEEFHRIFTREE